jgi:hypothetical protein
VRGGGPRPPDHHHTYRSTREILSVVRRRVFASAELKTYNTVAHNLAVHSIQRNVIRSDEILLALHRTVSVSVWQQRKEHER